MNFLGSGTVAQVGTVCYGGVEAELSVRLQQLHPLSLPYYIDGLP